MRKTICRLTVGILALAAVWFLPSYLLATLADGSADLELGQPDFSHNSPNCFSGSSLSNPYNIAIDRTSGRIYVCDSDNCRILWWNSHTSLTNGQSADGVIGQPNLYTNSPATCTQTGMGSPQGVAVDGSGNVWIADTYNSRVLEFAKPSANRQAAVLVLGQGDFYSNQPNQGLGWNVCTETTMCYPTGVSVDGSGNVWVADQNNYRVLGFANPKTNGQAANVVLGKSDFSHKDSVWPPTQAGLSYPRGVSVDGSGNVWVADGIPRVLKYSAPITNGMPASIVLGQADFNTYGGVCSRTGMAYPMGVSVDSAGNVWVADQNYNRALKYSVPISSGMPASIVIGQPDFTTYSSDCGPSKLRYFYGICVDSSGNVWIADTENSRILEFNDPSGNYPQANLVLGQNDFIHNNYTRDYTLEFPSDIAVDTSTGRVYVCDKDNSRILWWNSSVSFMNGKGADGVIGQGDLFTGWSNGSQFGLDHPQGVFVDGSGNVWVADTGDNRVLEFARPTANLPMAILVLGQGGYESADPDCSQFYLDYPSGVTVDSSGNVWVADTDNSRVLKFSVPLSNGMAASMVLGQQDYVSNNTACSQKGMAGPQGVSFDASGNLWVTDSDNSRVLKYSAPFSNGMAASMVLGEPDFTSINSSSGCSQTLTLNPARAKFDSSGNIWVADQNNNRVLKYSVPLSSGMPASLVIGQTDYASHSGACSQTGLFGPASMCLDSASNLWVADTFNNRVLKYMTVQQIFVDNSKDTTITFHTAYGDGTLFIPAGTFSSNVTLTMTVTQVPASTDPLIKLSAVGIEITNNLGLQPMKDIMLTLTYRLQDITGLIDTKLAIAYYDTTLLKWIVISSTVDTSRMQVTGYIRHFSKFAIVQALAAANLDSVKVFPNPLNSRTATGGMTIANLTATANIKIYNVAGELIRTLSYLSGNGQAVWDAKNDGGKQVASGVYIIYIDSPQGTKKIKVAVQK